MDTETDHIQELSVLPVHDRTKPAMRFARSPVNVMHVIEDLDRGGAERVLINLVRGLDRRRFNPIVCCLNKRGYLAVELERDGIPVIVSNKKSRLDLSHLFRLRAVMRRHSVDIVHGHVFTGNLWGRLAGILANVPCIVTHEHSSFTLDSRSRLLIERLLIYKTHKSITVSEQLRDHFVRFGRIPANRTITIHNGLRFATVERQASAGVWEDLKLGRFDRIIGTVGRFEYRKNYDLLLQAFARLIPEFPKTGLLLVGSGPEESRLKEKARSLNIADRTVFAGFRDDVASLLPLMSVFCMSSDTEGISMAILEAMSAGLPVVATRVGGNLEIVSDRSVGILVPPRDAGALADALKEILIDVNGHRQMGKRACERVQKFFSERMMIERVERLYEEILDQKGRSVL